MKRISALIMVALALYPSAAGAAGAEDVLRSVVFPGWGQYSSGRYTRGTLMFGAAIVTLAAIGGVTLQYNRHVDSYEDAYRRFEAATFAGDKVYYHRQATDSWDEADQLYRYRTLLIGIAAAVWTWSALDMVIGPAGGSMPVTLEAAPGGFRLSAKVSF